MIFDFVNRRVTHHRDVIEWQAAEIDRLHGELHLMRDLLACAEHELVCMKEPPC